MMYFHPRQKSPGGQNELIRQGMTGSVNVPMVLYMSSLRYKRRQSTIFLIDQKALVRNTIPRLYAYVY